MKCYWHLCSNLAVYQGKFCGQKCKNKYYVNERRRSLKSQAIEYKGGKCEDCGLSSTIPNVYDFHHIDPTAKDFGISAKGNTRSWDSIKLELDKCVLLCANCHRIRHHYLDYEKWRFPLDSNQDHQS